jgi:regulatory protein
MTRGARTGRGWDAAPPRPSRRRSPKPVEPENDPDLWGPDPAAAPSPSAEAPAEARGGRRKRGEPDGAPAERQPRDQREWAREICLRQLSVRPRTRSELATAMTKRGISAEIVEEVLDRYDEVGMIDDAAFARAWVDSRHHGKGLARRALGQELRRRGVDQEVIKGALAELEPETEEVTARELVERKLRTMRGEPDELFRKLVGMLARKGYPPGIAIRAVKDVIARRGEEEEAFAESRKVVRMRINAEVDWAETMEAEAAESEWDRPDRV